MPSRFETTTPGVGFMSGIEKELLRRETERRLLLAEERQRQQDELSRRNIESQMADRELDRARLIENDKINASDRRQQQALRKVGLLQKGQEITPDMDKDLGDLSPYVTEKKDPSMQVGVVQFPMQDIEGRDMPSRSVYRGSAAEQKDAAERERTQQVGKLLEGVSDRQEAARILLQQGISPDQADTFINAYMGPKATGQVGSFEDFVVQKYGPRPTPEQITAARKEYATADDSPRMQQPIIVQSGGNYWRVPRAGGTASPVLGPNGEPLGLADTAQTRERAASLKRVEPFINRITDFSSRINTKPGVEAIFSGGYRELKAKANEDDDVKVYLAMIETFTPMWARAVGHTGVLTEPDFEHSMAILPHPRDSQSVAQLKLEIMGDIMEADAQYYASKNRGQGGAPGAQTPGAGGGTQTPPQPTPAPPSGKNVAPPRQPGQISPGLQDLLKRGGQPR